MTLAAALGPALSGDGVAEGLAHGAGADAGGLGDAHRSALSMRLVTVVLVLLPGVGSGVVLVSAAALVMLPLGGDLHGQGQVPPAPLTTKLPGSRSDRAAGFAVCPRCWWR